MTPTTHQGPYLTLPGSSAYSSFRTARLAQSLGAESISAIWLHFINPYHASGLSATDYAILEQLLEYGTYPKSDDRLYQNILDALARRDQAGTGKVEARDRGVELWFVSPRAGTISPWSSKATSIAHVCRLDKSVRRIERGVCFAIRWPAGEEGKEMSEKMREGLFDRMTQELSRGLPDLERLFAEHAPRQMEVVRLGGDARAALQGANRRYGLALEQNEIDYLVDAYANKLKRDPTDVELFMFAQVNSEHCRHKQFNANWTIDGITKQRSLFAMIRNTHTQNPNYTISAYSDNAAVMQGLEGSLWAPKEETGEWQQTKEVVHYLAKVETHNHPTAVSPYPGAATGSGGEIRDEGAVGRGSKPKAGLAGFNVSDMNIPGFQQPWEVDAGKPHHIASSFDIMIEAPLGSAAFNNEFGRPCLTGYFRTLTTKVPISEKEEEIRGYHKPIMIAGGVGTVRDQHAIKKKDLVQPNMPLLIIGGPAMEIGLGGGAASSLSSGESSAALDFASVQRGNAEMERRAQEVINACTALGTANPIRFIHDVGAGGASNAFPELVGDSGLGAKFELRELPTDDRSLSPLQLWCCEAQERYVLAVSPEGLDLFRKIAKRERCPYAIVGYATGQVGNPDNRLVLTDRDSVDHPMPIDLPMPVLFGSLPRVNRIVDSRPLKLPTFDSSLSSYLPRLPQHDLVAEAVNRVLTLPAVGSKSFLITIGDRTVGGLTTRDQMVGPWQVPVADVAVTATSLLPGIKTGEAMAMGERPTLALISPAASARMAVAESLTNIAAANLLGGLERIRLSANWMSAVNHPGEGAALYEAVEAIGMQLCPQLGISIPVGKDSMSMKMKWQDAESKDNREVTAPLSLVISAFAPVRDIADTWTPALRRLEDVGETVILFVDLAKGMKALGGSALAQVFGQVGSDAPDVREVDLLKDFFDGLDQLFEAGIVLAYHDRSDGGLLAALVECMFAGRCGLEISLEGLCPLNDHKSIMETLFNEELGAIFQVRKQDEIEFHRCFATCGPPPGLIKRIGRVPVKSKQELSIRHGVDVIYRASRKDLQQKWASTSYQMQKLRDNPECADAEFASIRDDSDPGLSFQLTFNPKENILPLTASMRGLFANKPRVAILREQGTNGAPEAAFAMAQAGFLPVDVHMSDFLAGRVSLEAFTGLMACGGFSYGDVLGAGQGWAKSVLLHEDTRKQFEDFFKRPNTFTLGVCNGCQFLSRLKELIPGAEAWPTFERNISEQYEARVCMVEVLDEPAKLGREPSVFLYGMAGSKLPIVTAHGEGRADFGDPTTSPISPQALYEEGLVSMRFVDNYGKQTEQYPYNPNGSPMGVTGVRSKDGRVLAMMPHPERTILKDVGSYIDREQAKEWGEFGPWCRLFRSARRWVG